MELTRSFPKKRERKVCLSFKEENIEWKMNNKNHNYNYDFKTIFLFSGTIADIGIDNYFKCQNEI